MRKLLIGSPILLVILCLVFGFRSQQEEIVLKTRKDGGVQYKREQLTDKTFLEKKLGIVKEKKKVMNSPGFEHPDKFLQYYHEITQGGPEVNAEGYPANHRQVALDRAIAAKYGSKENRLSGIAPPALDWEQRGPNNVAGRTRAIIVDLDADPTGDTWFAGSASGGIWKTVDAGATWENLTPDLAFLTTQSLAQSQSNPAYMYAGTGEGWLPGLTVINGNGIYKSDDRGQTWNQLPSTVNATTANQFRNVSRIIVHPASPDTVVVTTNAGIFKSDDGGTTWNQVLDTTTSGNAASQVVYDGSDFSVQYACITTDGIYKSTDAGETWDLVFQPPGIGGFPAGRIEVAIAPTNTSRLAATVETVTGGQNDMYLSDDAGATWTRVDEQSGNFVWMGGQGWYDNTLAFHPFSEDTIFFAGVGMYRGAFVAGADTATIFTASTTNTSSFLSFVNFGGNLLGGGLSTDPLATFGLQSDLQPEDYRNVEIRFGPGNTQRAHRFLSVGPPFQDYIDVPFSVWDTTNNQQLMVSFRDNNQSGAFDLTDPNGNDRQYIFVTNLPYDPVDPDTNIVANGPLQDAIYFIWPVAPAGVAWDPSTHPESQININLELLPVAFRSSNRIDSFSFSNPQPNNVHVDHHNITMIPFDVETNSYRLVNGNDGGVAYSDDGGQTFTETRNGYITTQFYGADKRPGHDEYVGGMQDNGTWQSPPAEAASSASDYIFQIGGDGFDAVWNGANDEEWIGGAQGNFFFLVTNASLGANATFTPIFPLLDGGNGPFISILANTKSNSELVLTVGPAGVYRSDDFGRTWTLTPIAEPAWGFSGSRTEIVQSIANPQIVWAGRRFSSLAAPSGRLHVSVDGGLSFSPIENQFTVTDLFSISGFETHPFEDSTAYVLHSRPASPKIVRTTDLGNTWEDISGYGANSTSDRGFPDVAVYSLLVLPHQPSTIWAGTEIGIFESLDNGNTWAFADNGLPAVTVWQMKVVDDQIVVATHGRGIWTVTIPELPPPPVVTLPPRLKNLGGGGGGVIGALAELRAPYDSSFVTVDGARVLSFEANAEPSDSAITILVATNGIDTVNVAMMAYKDGTVLSTAQFPIIVFPLNDPQAAFAEDFDQDRDNFLFNGFSLDTPAGFSDGAIHTPHPYPAAVNLTAVLKTPIEVASSNATLEYDDVTLVEPGAGTGVFGDPLFFDFVIVEGSNDNGTTWVPLADGYDSRADATWLAAFGNGSGVGDSSMFVHHSIDLLNTFSAGDLILVRFRLFADGGAEGWGWAIDNLNIQDGVVSVDDGPELPRTFSLSQNFPNPFNPTTNINYTLPQTADVTLSIYNVLGQNVVTLVDENQKAGAYTVQWNGRNKFGNQVSSGLYFYRIKAGEFVKSFKMTLLK